MSGGFEFKSHDEDIDWPAIFDGLSHAGRALGNVGQVERDHSHSDHGHSGRHAEAEGGSSSDHGHGHGTGTDSSGFGDTGRHEDWRQQMFPPPLPRTSLQQSQQQQLHGQGSTPSDHYGSNDSGGGSGLPTPSDSQTPRTATPRSEGGIKRSHTQPQPGIAQPHPGIQRHHSHSYSEPITPSSTGPGGGVGGQSLQSHPHTVQNGLLSMIYSSPGHDQAKATSATTAAHRELEERLRRVAGRPSTSNSNHRPALHSLHIPPGPAGSGGSGAGYPRTIADFLSGAGAGAAGLGGDAGGGTGVGPNAQAHANLLLDLSRSNPSHGNHGTHGNHANHGGHGGGHNHPTLQSLQNMSSLIDPLLISSPHSFTPPHLSPSIPHQGGYDPNAHWHGPGPGHGQAHAHRHGPGHGAQDVISGEGLQQISGAGSGLSLIHI